MKAPFKIHPFALVLVIGFAAASSFRLRAELIEPVGPFIQRVEAALVAIPEDRQKVLGDVVDYLVPRIQRGVPSKLVFICTHNSRRSQFSQIWCQAAVAHYDVPGVQAYSGGTEATACNPRTVGALQRAGLSVDPSTEGENPIYRIRYSNEHPPALAFSKVYSSKGNPASGFAAMMCCSDADQRCPTVIGADERFALHYDDPKVADDTPSETQRYDERCFEIAREMFFIMSEVSRRIDGDASQSD